MSARPVRSVSQVAAALDVPTSRAAQLLDVLEMLGLIEHTGRGFQATGYAWANFPRPERKTPEGRRAA